MEGNIREEKCQSCNKALKTVRGLLRHNAFTRLRSLVKEYCQAIASDSCYGTEINAKFELYCRQVDIEDTFISEQFCSAAKKALSKLVDQKSKERFYAEY